MLSRTFEDGAYPAREARRFARSALDRYGEVAEVAELLVSELATNVVRHACPPFTVELSINCQVVRVSVADGATVDLRVTQADGDQTSGRGLQLLEALSRRWGVERTTNGKRVWFELSLDVDHQSG